MSGVNAITTTSAAGTFVGAWHDFVSTAQNYGNGSTTAGEFANAGAALVSAAGAFSSNSTFAGVANLLGLGSSINSFKSDLASFQDARQLGDINKQITYALGMISDVSGVAGATAAGLAAIQPETIPVCLRVEGTATIIGGAAATAKLYMDATTALQKFLEVFDDGIRKGSIEGSHDWELLNDSGQTTIIFAGQNGDGLSKTAASSGDLSGFAFAETNGSGTSSITLLTSIAGGTSEILSGSGVATFVSNSTVSLTAGTSATVNGSGLNINAADGATINVGGNGPGGATNAVYVNHGTVNIGDSARTDVHASDTIINAGTNDNFGVWGDRNTAVARGADGIWVGGSGNHVTDGDGGTVTEGGNGPGGDINSVYLNRGTVYLGNSARSDIIASDTIIYLITHKAQPVSQW